MDDGREQVSVSTRHGRPSGRLLSTSTVIAICNSGSSSQTKRALRGHQKTQPLTTSAIPIKFAPLHHTSRLATGQPAPHPFSTRQILVAAVRYCPSYQRCSAINPC
ncbi:hypothetical protein SNOG_00800 [Parastagonospora nodorum SN15]|uniref:Uncharacterized protein n=1 Tax=Phaeosphaeria nodorum (strain SN15 / ATCC MYA-4574 / FGSC 10173) TaxID=321614 RepID=Q0V5B4_PHANO|nr:hypothetical protein SNOG_00800 [Parastagonospora nodorum SN15]EAT92295.1 hypothetical protein SNOG_00800 [Parastagonospora nodorum SN15]